MEAYVVGGGPVGLFAAACLHERGVQVGVVDAECERLVRGYACGLHPETLRLFDRLGMMPVLQEVGHRVDRVFIYRGTERVGVADFARLEGRFPHVLTLRQSDLQDALARELARLGVEVCSRQEVTKLTESDGSVCAIAVPRAPRSDDSAASEGVHFGKDPVVRHADYVVGADGYQSACREALGIEVVDLKASEAFVLFEFEADLTEWQHEAQLALGADTVSAFWPLGPNLGRWTFQIWEQLDETPSLDTLRDLLQQRAPWFRPRPEQLAWSATAHFERRIARSFGAGRVWLAGDAAHVTSPIGFQNMNRGFVEASELADAISSTLQGQPSGSGSLERFEHGQQAEWRRLLGIRSRVRSKGALTSGEGARLVSCLPASGRDLDALLGQLGLRIAPGAGAASTRLRL
jgi:2-polyprenyl-6-methoxyphenol hydroxylase-like FAD-dependent oxidoreductase